MASVKKTVGNIGALWKKAKQEAKSSGFGEAIPVEPGKYNMQFVKGTIGDFGGKRQAMLKFCVVGDSDEKGSICTTWLSLEEDRIVWLVRTLAAMGFDTDSLDESATEDDLQNVFDGLVENNVVCACKVREKDGYTNLYINNVVDIDTDDLVDPAEVLKGGSSGGDSKDNEKSEDDGETEEKSNSDDDTIEIEAGDRVRWRDGKKQVEGEIVAFDKDDNAVIRPDGTKKTVTKALDEIEKIEAEETEKADDGDDGDRVAEVGDVVIFEFKGKDKSGVVEKLKGDKAFVKVKGEPKPVEVDVEDLKFATD
jgi:small nuclear ribonucleoprotein (snRNP)-like protein